MERVPAPCYKYLPSLLLGVFIGILLTAIVSYEECFLSESRSKLSTNAKLNTVENASEQEELKAVIEAENELLDIKKFVADIDKKGPAPASVTNTAVADKLKKEVRILCFILTYPPNHESRVKVIKNTWGKRCNKFLVMSSKTDRSVNAIGLNVTEDHDHLWSKTKKALQYIYKHHYREADWFFKADDDTYAYLENMRYFLHSYSPNDPIYFGYKMKTIVKQGYFSGGAGYVLSKKALSSFLNKALPDPKLCKQEDTGAEDAEMGVCLQNVHIYAGDTRDSLGRGRFFINGPVDHLRESNVNLKYWYWRNQYYRNDEGLDCCSDRAISWHYLLPKTILHLDFFMYKFHVYGRVSETEPLPSKLNFTEVASKLEQEEPFEEKT